jgi:tRNA(Ile)-lysidine synthase
MPAGYAGAAALGPWSVARRIAVAVSGGADSMALAVLARRYAEPLALIVDHRLRPESTAEAAETASRLASIGITSRILTLRGLLPGPGLAARARAARYAALAAAAREAGLSDLLLGHHAGDQAETFLIRQAARSGPDGLACMASVVDTVDLRLLRPLLANPPERLRDLLRRLGIGWVEDPGNHSPAATRTRMRARLAEGGSDRRAALLALTRAAGLARRRREEQLAARLAERARIFPEGYAILSPGPADAAILAALIRGLTGAAYPVGRAALARLAAASLRGTLGGVRFMPAGRYGAGTLLVREEAAMQGSVAAVAGARWDGRFRLESDVALPAGAEIAALGDDAIVLRRRSGHGSAVLRTLPALRLAGEILCVPHLGYFNKWTNRSLRLSFCPPTPVAGAPFAVGGVGDAQTS